MDPKHRWIFALKTKLIMGIYQLRILFIFNTGWVKFVRIISAFATALLGLGLLILLVYLKKKSQTVKKFAGAVVFIAGGYQSTNASLLYISKCVI